MSFVAREAWEAVLDCLFPVTCAACPKPGRAPFCALCIEALEPAPRVELQGLVSVQAPYEYGGPMALALQALKFEGRAEVGPPLGRLVAGLVGAPAVDLIVPIPLSRRRLTERGYNQARELARGLGTVASPRALARVEDRAPQVGLSREARLHHQDGAFRAETALVEGARVLLVDDVISTGATLCAAAEALEAAGAVEIHAVAAARALTS